MITKQQAHEANEIIEAHNFASACGVAYERREHVLQESAVDHYPPSHQQVATARETLRQYDSQCRARAAKRKKQ